MNDSNSTSPNPTSRAERALKLALYLAIGFFAFQVLTFGYGRDQGIYGVVARAVLDGQMPYRDVFDFKPPGIYLIYALSRILFHNSWSGIRTLEVVSLLISVWCSVRLARKWWNEPTVGLLAGALATMVHAQLDFWHSAQPETFGGMLTMLGLWLAVRHSAERPAAWRDWLACGIVFGLAGLLKPPLAGGGAIVALWAAHERWRTTQSTSRFSALRHACPPVLWVLIGGLLPFGGVLLWFASQQALAALYETFLVYTPHYTALAWEGRSLTGMLYQAFSEWLINFCSAITIGLLISLAFWRQCYARRGVPLIGALIGVQLVGVALQGKFFPYHYAACWPLTAMLAGLGWWQLWRWGLAGRHHRWVGVLLAFVIASSLRTATKDLSDSFWQRTAKRTAFFLFQQGDPNTADALASVADVNAAGNRGVADILRERVGPGQTIYIWGFEPVIYDLTDRPAASRYIYNAPQRSQWSAARTQGELMRELDLRPPQAIVVAHHDIFPMVTGDARDSATSLKHFPALKQLLAEDYRKFKRVQDFDIYLRSPKLEGLGIKNHGLIR